MVSDDRPSSLPTSCSCNPLSVRSCQRFSENADPKRNPEQRISPSGVQLDPLSYLVVGLHARFAPPGEETRLQAMTGLLSFGRRNGEGINQVLTRYEIVRQRARTEGLFVMSTEGCALQLLRVCGVSTNQMMQLLQPFHTNPPANEQQLNVLFAYGPH